MQELSRASGTEALAHDAVPVLKSWAKFTDPPGPRRESFSYGLYRRRDSGEGVRSLPARLELNPPTADGGIRGGSWPRRAKKGAVATGEQQDRAINPNMFLAALAANGLLVAQAPKVRSLMPDTLQTL